MPRLVYRLDIDIYKTGRLLLHTFPESESFQKAEDPAGQSPCQVWEVDTI